MVFLFCWKVFERAYHTGDLQGCDSGCKGLWVEGSHVSREGWVAQGQESQLCSQVTGSRDVEPRVTVGTRKGCEAGEWSRQIYVCGLPLFIQMCLKPRKNSPKWNASQTFLSSSFAAQRCYPRDGDPQEGSSRKGSWLHLAEGDWLIHSKCQLVLDPCSAQMESVLSVSLLPRRRQEDYLCVAAP